MANFIFEFGFLVFSAFVEIEIIENIKLFSEIIDIDVFHVFDFIVFDDLFRDQIFGFGNGFQVTVVQIDHTFIVAGEIEHVDIVSEDSVEQERDPKKSE